MKLEEKYQALLLYIRDLESVAIGYSGGVDSSFLLAAAKDAVGDRALGVIGRSVTYPEKEMNEAIALAEKIGAKTVVIDTDEINDPAFYTNPPTRCFACKSTLFKGVWEAARSAGIKYVLEGSNADDAGDFRPGMDAARGLLVKAPLLDLKFTKEEIRAMSKELGLPTWNKPAMACLSSRVPFGQIITVEKLSRIEKAEMALRSLGFVQLRVRDYDDLCRIEVLAAELTRFAEDDMRKKAVAAMKDAGYRYVCLDLEGFRSGSMNAALSDDERAKARDKGRK